MDVLTKGLAISPSTAALLTACASLIRKLLTNTIDPYYPPNFSLYGRESHGRHWRGGGGVERERERGTAIQSVGLRFKECGNQQIQTKGKMSGERILCGRTRKHTRTSVTKISYLFK